MLYYRLMVAAVSCMLLAFAATGQESQPQSSSEPSAEPVTVIPMEPKKDGTIRIAIAPVKTQINHPDPGQDMSESMLDRWYTFLQGPAVEIVPMESRIAVQVKMEARQKGCDYILFSTVTQKGKSNLFASLFKTAIPVVASSVPIPVGGGVAGAVQNGAVNAAKNVGVQAATNIKANDHVTLDYDFVSVSSSASLVAKSLKGKAKTDGEDVFSNLIEQASGQFLELALK